MQQYVEGNLEKQRATKLPPGEETKSLQKDVE